MAFRNISKIAAVALALAVVSLNGSSARAQCENPSSASDAMNGLVQQDISNLNKFINQEWNFIDEDLTNTATNEVAQRMDQFDKNVIAALNDWWNNKYLPASKQMTRQWNTVQIDQSASIGNFLNNQSLEENKLAIELREADAHKRFRPAESTCQIDSIAPGAVKAQRVSRALARSFSASSMPDRANKVGSPSASGFNAGNAARWQEYVSEFCDPAQGDQGCAVPGIYAGKNTDIPGLLFGDKLTLDMSSAANQKITQAAVRTLIAPEAADPVPKGAVNTSAGRDELLRRRAERTRENTIGHSVGRMLGERSNGSGVDASTVRASAGVALTDTTTDQSYKELSDALGRSRFLNPEYLTRLVDDPVQLVREQGAINAVKSRSMSNIIKSREDTLVMQAGRLGAQLDLNPPPTASVQRPSR